MVLKIPTRGLGAINSEWVQFSFFFEDEWVQLICCGQLFFYWAEFIDNYMATPAIMK